MKPPSNVKTPAQYIASLPADRAKTIATVRAFVNKHIPRGYDECLVWGTIGWTIPLSRYPDTYNKQPICYVALSSQKNYCSLYLMGAFWSASQRPAEGGVQGGGEEARHGEVLRSFRVAGRFAARSDWQADLGDFEREVDRDVRTIALDDQGGPGADGEARRPIGEQGGRQARRHQASAVDFPSKTRRYGPPRFPLLLRVSWRLRRVARTMKWPMLGSVEYCGAVFFLEWSSRRFSPQATRSSRPRPDRRQAG